MFLALKELKKEKARFTMIVSVIILITYLVYFLSSLAYGLATINRTAVDYWDAEGIIISKSANGNLYASSIEEERGKEVSNRSDNMINITNSNIYLESDKNELVSAVFIGVDLSNDTIVPKIIEGQAIESDFEVILSNNIKNDLPLELGDEIVLSQSKRKFKVVGFTEDSNFNTSPVVYAKREMVSQAMMQYDTSETLNDTQSSPTIMMPKQISAIIVNDKEALINERDLSTLDLEYLNIDEFINVLPGYKAQVLTFGLMIISLSLIVSVIMGIFMYILTMQKKSIFAILKIQGYQNSFIIQSIIIQILTLLIIGISIGLLLTVLTVMFLPASVPIAFNWILISVVSAFIVITSLLGAVFSARSVLKIDPLEAL